MKTTKGEIEREKSVHFSSSATYLYKVTQSLLLIVENYANHHHHHHLQLQISIGLLRSSGRARSTNYNNVIFLPVKF